MTQKKQIVAKKSKKNQKKKTPDNAAQQYRAALSAPFTLAAQGARVPDMYSVPTTTRHITRTFTVSANALGECDVVVLPSAYWHAFSPRGSLVNGGTWSLLDGTSVANAVQYTTPNVLAGQLTNYRIVGYGVRVFGISSMTSTQGKVLAATVPLSSWINESTATVGGQNSNHTNTSATAANTLKAYGIPQGSGIVNVAAIPSLPNSMETSMVRITENPLNVIPKISGPEAFSLRQVDDSALGFNITDQTSNVFIASGDASYLRLAGHEAVVICATGCAASTNVLEVEVCYHLEGNPYQSTAGFGVIGNDSTATVVNPISWMNVIQSVARLPAFKEGVTTIGNSFFPGLGTLANRFL